MRVRRLLASLLATAVVAPAAALSATTAPAAAATPTTVVGGYEGGHLLNYYPGSTQPGALMAGETIYVSASVRDSSGSTPSEGTLTLQRQLAGSSAWTTVTTTTSSYLSATVKAAGNATYRVVYASAGGYDPSQASETVKVQRALNAKGVDEPRRFGIAGRVAPKYAKKAVTVQKKVAGKWRKYSVVRTDAKSRFFARVAAPARRGGKITYRVIIPGSKQFAPTDSGAFVATKY